MNLILGVISIFVTFSAVVIFEKLFKREGLFVWVAISTITANIIVCKNIDILGFTATLGNVMFASNFLATDIMSEKYSFKDGRKAIVLGVVSQIIFIIMTMLAVAYIPSSEDISHESMKTLFTINFRVSIASITMYFASNMLDIYLFEKLKKKFPKQLWLRNNISTIISNCLENYFFTFFAFVGLYDITTILAIATSTSVIEMIIAILDTPFLYISKKIK